MEYSLKKMSTSIDIRYLNHEYSNTIIGTDFRFAPQQGINLIYINLESNLKQRNKMNSLYIETSSFYRKHQILEQVQINDDHIIKNLIKFKKSNNDNNWRLILNFDSKNNFEYEVTPSKNLVGISLDVKKFIKHNKQ